jgi:hypothetical protein
MIAAESNVAGASQCTETTNYISSHELPNR